MVSTSNERQAALRAKRRQEGLSYIHVWANPEQEQSIKAYLAEPDKNRLHVTPDGMDDVMSDKSQLHVTRDGLDDAIDDEMMKLRFALQTQEFELNQRRNELESLAIQLEKEARELKAAGAQLRKEGTSKVVTDKERAEALVHRFTTTRAWGRLGDVYVPITEPWAISQRSKEITRLTAQTKSAGTALAKLADEFKELLGESEISDLGDAVRILRRIAESAELAQKKTRALEAHINSIEEKNQKLARQAASQWLEGMKEADQLMLLATLDLHHYGLGYLISCLHTPSARTWERLLRDALGDVRETLVDQIVQQLRTTPNLADVLASIRNASEQKRPLAEAKFRGQIQEVIAAVVAERLSKANGG